MNGGELFLDVNCVGFWWGEGVCDGVSDVCLIEDVVVVLVYFVVECVDFCGDVDLVVGWGVGVVCFLCGYEVIEWGGWEEFIIFYVVIDDLYVVVWEELVSGFVCVVM